MTCGFVSIRLRQLMYVKLTNQSVTYVSGTFVTLDTGLNKGGQGGILKFRVPLNTPERAAGIFIVLIESSNTLLCAWWTRMPSPAWGGPPTG